jgi:ABC-type sugar transport system ATPase subunit
MTTQKSEIIRLEGITKRFGGVLALNNVSLEIKAGEVHAVLGENGAGKSTLMKILAGVYEADSGQIFLDGKEVKFSSPRDAQQKGISIVFQELNLFPQLSVAGNIFINRELEQAGLLNERQMTREAQKVLDLMRVEIDPLERVSDLAQGQRQLVEIARALYHEPKIIIMDEPNSALTDKETQILFDVIRRLRDQGVTILYISHRLEEVFEIADRISVFRDGRFEGAWGIDGVTMEFVVSKMIGRKLEEAFPARPNLPPTAPTALRVKNLSKVRSFEAIDFEVRRGEVLGFAGLQGCGIEEIFQILFGLTPFASGEIEFDGRTRLPDSPVDAIGMGWGLVPAERRSQGLMPAWSIRQNMSLPILDRIRNVFSMISQDKEKKMVGEAISRYRISTDSMDKMVLDLSGGNQQKVVVAKWLATNPKILLLNDPTRGIDVGAKAEIYGLINQLAKEGLAILLTSSEIEEVIGLSDRILVLYKGRLVKEFRKGEATKADVMGYVAGGSIAETAQTESV